MLINSYDLKVLFCLILKLKGMTDFDRPMTDFTHLHLVIYYQLLETFLKIKKFECKKCF